MEGKTEIFNYINSCDKCFAAFLDDTNHPEVLFIKYKKIYKDGLILGISQKDSKCFHILSNNNIAVTAWNNIKGYQLKGYPLSEGQENHKKVLENYKQHLEDIHGNLSTIQFVLYNIKEIYYVTPGVLAGKLVEMEVSPHHNQKHS